MKVDDGLYTFHIEPTEGRITIAYFKLDKKPYPTYGMNKSPKHMSGKKKSICLFNGLHQKYLKGATI